jgi:hypothetical protein
MPPCAHPALPEIATGSTGRRLDVAWPPDLGEAQGPASKLPLVQFLPEGH